MVKNVPIGKVKANPNNPRFIRDEKFAKLCNSLREFPDMAKLRPIIVNADMVVLGGNMRLKAMKEIGWQEVPIIVADNLTPEQQREFVIKDNVAYGQNNWEMLANEWDEQLLTDWGLDIQGFEPELPEDNPEDSEINSLFVQGEIEQLEDLFIELDSRGFKVKFK